MIQLQIKLISPGFADGHYIIKAKGFILAVLNWGNKNGCLEDWGAFAYVPIDPAGNGDFRFSGSRGIPKEATHVCVRCFSPDFSSYEDIIFAIPEKYLNNNSCISKHSQKFSVLTDLHLSSKPWRIKQALRAAKSEIIFLLGDSTNDGLREQFEQFNNCIREIVPDKIIFPVIGNHDVLHVSQEKNANGCENYADFQKKLLTNAEEKGFYIEYDDNSLAYSVQIKNIDLIGLQSVISGRKFLFPEGKQFLWLENHLKTNNNFSLHLILCHAPLLAHNPNRNVGNPYLSNNKILQEIIDRYGQIMFLSGHTHVSPNMLKGNGEFDNIHENIYLDCGSVVATDISGYEGLMSLDWNDGCITELSITENEIEICMSSIKTGIKFPRGYYHFNLKNFFPATTFIIKGSPL